MHVQILGSRGIPSHHGGFETFAQDLAIFLTERGHRVTVYCQVGAEEEQREDTWQGIRRILIPSGKGAAATIKFDWKSALHACSEDGIALTLGYNTAIFSFLYKLTGHRNIMNMDGLEWKRQKWSATARAWLRLNEWLGSKLSDHLIADHPMIKQHLTSHTNSEKITVIPYGSQDPESEGTRALDEYGLTPGKYYLMIARAEPENSILEVVSAYSAEKRSVQLVVLGKYFPQNKYHEDVLSKAGPGIKFVGAIYDRKVVAALRCNALAYIHGHQVGGTNPSLVESLAAGNPVIAHDNVFTRWVVGDSGMYFKDENELKRIFERIDESPESIKSLGLVSRQSYLEKFRQENILSRYQTLLHEFSGSGELPNLQKVNEP